MLVDPETLTTLPRRHLRAGLAEVVKMGMAVDATLFRWLEREGERLLAGDRRALEEAIVRSVRAKARVVIADEREAGPRTALNFGHTVGHALETVTGYRGLLHGEAVALGMGVAAALSERLAGLPATERRQLERLLAALRLARRFPRVPAAALLDAMERDKKRAGGVRWVLTPRVGHASVPRLISRRLARSALLEAGAIA